MSGAPPLAVVGIGEDGLKGLGPRARSLLDTAALFVGGRRHLDFLGDDLRPRLPWRSPLLDTVAELRAVRDRVVVLASGDPSWYGVATLLRRSFQDREVEVVPAVSAVQLAAARLGWAVETADVVSLHGRPMESLRRWLGRGRRLLLLTDGADAPGRIAALAAEAEFGAAALAVLERLGGPAERMTRGTAAAPPPGPFDPLHVVALDLSGDVASGLPLTPGLPDDAYEHDGQLTKLEVRAITLARLAPREGETLWDVGAGSGAVAIEWLRGARRTAAVAVERDPDRAARARLNARRLGVPELEVVEGDAPDCLGGLPSPDAAFVGGGVGTPGLLEAVWAALPADGRLVANAVTLAGEAALSSFHARHGGRLTRLAVARAELVGAQTAWRPLMPVTQLAVAKRPCGAAS